MIKHIQAKHPESYAEFRLARPVLQKEVITSNHRTKATEELEHVDQEFTDVLSINDSDFSNAPTLKIEEENSENPESLITTSSSDC